MCKSDLALLNQYFHWSAVPWPEAGGCLPHICMYYGSVWGNKQALLLFCLPAIIIPLPSDGLRPTVHHLDERRFSDCLMAIRLCIFTAHESLYTENPIATYCEAPPPPLAYPSLFYFLCRSASSSLPFQLIFSPSQTASVPWSCSVRTPSWLIKACIINTAASLSILLSCSYDCYIKFQLFRCNSLLMLLL